MNAHRWHHLAALVRERDVAGLALLLGEHLPLVEVERLLVIGKALQERCVVLRKLRDREPDMTARQAQERDVAMLARYFPSEERGYLPHPRGDEARYRERLARGHECLLVEIAGSPVAMGWVEFGAGMPTDVRYRVAFPNGSCWGYDTFVREEYRQRGAYAVLMHEMFRDLEARGLRRLYAEVGYFNAASRAAHQRLGYAVAAVFDEVRVGPLRLARVRVGAGRGRWLRTREDRKPVIALTVAPRVVPARQLLPVVRILAFLVVDVLENAVEAVGGMV